MSDQYDTALAFVLKHEGGKSNDPHDPGGRTNQGITQAAYDTYRQWKGLKTRDVFDMSNSERDTIYCRDYWIAISASQLPHAIAIFGFDAAVQHGVHESIVLLQQAAGVTSDGDMGPVTLGAINGSNTHHLLQEYGARRMHYYGDLSEFSRYGLGWSRRMIDCYSLAFQWL